MRLEAMAVKIPAVAGHPNRISFEGVLTLVDIASDRAPSGARGHRVILTRAAAKLCRPCWAWRWITVLVGMGMMPEGNAGS